jgi:aspartyl-tRNA(Asn)/glutamyl-tRNA(Gln) amidotransferase subunit A
MEAKLPAADLANRHALGSVAPAETVKQAFARANEVRAGAEGLNALLSTDREAALGAADEVSRLHREGNRPRPLAGVPVVVKANIATLNMPTSCGSRILEHYVSPFESTVVTRLRTAGAIVIGKTNMDEFAMGSSTENSAFGPAKNPLDPTRVPGGSSGGSAACVAAGIVRIALGSETGGSVRQPASFCGVVGVKPTYGRVSRYGLVAFASSLDQIGVFRRTVDDAALGLGAVAGRDRYDSTSADVPVDDYRALADGDLEGVTVGRPREYFPESLDARIRDRCDASLELLRGLGARVRDVSLPHTELAIPTYYVIAPAEASSNLARFDGVRYGLRVDAPALRDMYERTRSEGFGPEVTRRILLGTYVLSAGYYDAYYRKAQEVRALIAHDFRRVFDSGVNVLFTPTAPTPAFPLGTRSDPYDMYLSDIFTATANLAGIPALSLPVGRVEGMPVGGQVMASHFDEATLFRVAYALEQALGEAAHR